MQLNNATNVVAYYNATCDQLELTRYLRKQANLPRNAPLYFDDADLVWEDETIVSNALVNKTLTMQHLISAVLRATVHMR